MRRSLFIFLFLSFFSVCAGIFLYYSVETATRTIPIEGKVFLVKKGWNTSNIAQALYNEKIIRSPKYFRLLTRILKKDSSIQAGLYNIKSNISTYKMILLLTSGNTILEKITIPEGLTSRAISKLLVKSGIITSQEEFFQAIENPEIMQEFRIFAKNAEGFLFPSTYVIEKPYPAKKMVHMMINAFFKNIKKIYPAYTTMSWDELYDKVIVSSIVEKEYRVENEASIIASVFYNRLKSNIALESCASIIYILTEVLGRPHPNRLFYIDLEINNPYNSYLYKGLPPSPIANPGPIALAASFQPAQTNYLFFVVDDTSIGTHKFSSNVAEHEEGKRRYLEAYFPK